METMKILCKVCKGETHRHWHCKLKCPRKNLIGCQIYMCCMCGTKGDLAVEDFQELPCKDSWQEETQALI